jgi:hypothetical protein
MQSEECLRVIKKINDCLKENQWMDFEVCKMNEGQIILSGKLDELDEEIIEISFIQPFMVSCLMNFSFEDGDFISLVEGEEAIGMNKKYKVEQGNYIFRLSIDDNEKAFFIMAREIDANIFD